MAAAVGSAQELGNDTTTEPVETEPGEVIDNNTRLISATYDEDNGTAEVVIESDSLQKITLTDAGGFISGGEIEQRSVVVRPDERVTISIPVTEAENGFVGVSVGTSQTLYAVPIEHESNLNPFIRTPPQASWMGGAAAMLVSVVGAGWYTRSSQPDEPEVME